MTMLDAASMLRHTSEQSSITLFAMTMSAPCDPQIGDHCVCLTTLFDTTPWWHHRPPVAV